MQNGLDIVTVDSHGAFTTVENEKFRKNTLKSLEAVFILSFVTDIVDAIFPIDIVCDVLAGEAVIPINRGVANLKDCALPIIAAR